MLVRGVQAARSADPGFTMDDVTPIAIEMPASAYGGARTKVFARQLATGLAAVPDMPHWGLSMDAPLSNGKTVTVYHTDRDKQDRQGLIHEGSGGYFDGLQIPVLAGRNFTPEDLPRQTILIYETLAKNAWPGVSA